MAILKEVGRYPNPDAIRAARRVCALAERGEIMSVGWVTVSRGGDVTTSWSTSPGDRHKITAGASMLAYRVTKDAEDSAD